eukprot:gb/GECG01014446.1/.p1 GENE.gb/GECG01014446.1/~~gb/GECG01014446.1/.p1  ORF type:complete len:312 (+),score=18.26 gb/GECG01014446.1/:1-936(+)
MDNNPETQPQESQHQHSTSWASQQSQHADNADSFDVLEQSQSELPAKITRQQFLSQFELHNFRLMTQPIVEMKWYLFAAVFLMVALVLALRPASDGGDVKAIHLLWLLASAACVATGPHYPTGIRITDSHLGLRYKTLSMCGYDGWRIIPLESISRVDICKAESIRACGGLHPSIADYRIHNGVMPTGDACQIDLKRRTCLGIRTFLLVPQGNLNVFVEQLTAACFRNIPGADTINFPAMSASPLRSSFAAGGVPNRINPTITNPDITPQNFGNAPSRGRGRGKGRRGGRSSRSSFKQSSPNDPQQENPLR